MNKKTVVLSCEHGGNLIPEKYRSLFKSADNVLNTHRGYDIGALELFDLFKNGHVVYNKSAMESRLLVDINRSLHRRTLFSEFTRVLPKAEKQKLLSEYYYGFRKSFEEQIMTLWNENNTVLHISVHSFTPVLNGEVRHTDFGILYDPERTGEKQFSRIWRDEISKVLPNFRTRFNYPFRGKPDGHVKHFRDKEAKKYLGIEFEMNQKYATDTKVKMALAKAFDEACVLWLNS